MKAQAIISLPMKTEKQVVAVVSALEPEITRQAGIRSKATVATEGLTLLLSVEAEDTVALRAALNAYLRWISSTMNVLKVASEK